MASAAERPTRRVLHASASITLLLALLLCITTTTAAPALEKYDRLRLLPTGRTVLGQDSLNLNCGGDRAGRFIGDQYKWLLGGTTNTERDLVASAPIEGADKENLPAMFSNRYGRANYTGKWGYKIPVMNPGVFSCTAHFAELSTVKAGERVFNLEINAHAGSQKWTNIDVVKENGKFAWVGRWLTKPLVVTRYIEVLVQKTPTSKHGAIINAITCQRSGSLPLGVKPEAAPSAPRPPFQIVKIGRTFPAGPVMKGDTFAINSGGVKTIGKWLKDEAEWRHYGANTRFDAPSNVKIGGSAGDEERALSNSAYGVNGVRFGYQIPVATSGLWECHLQFAELDPEKKVGDRVFDVQVQDQQLPGYDTLKAAGSIFTKAVLTFNQVPVTDYVAIIMHPKVGDVSINAIECTLTKAMTVDEVKKVITSRQIAAGVKPDFPSPTPSVSPSAQDPKVDTTNTASTLQDGATVPEGTAEPDLLRDVTLDAKLQNSTGDVINVARLQLIVPAGTEIDNNLLLDIKEIVRKHTKAKSDSVAMTSLKLMPNQALTVRFLSWVTRAFASEPTRAVSADAISDSDSFLETTVRAKTTAPTTAFETESQYQLPEAESKAATASLTTACSDNDGKVCTDEIQATGCAECTLKLIAAPVALSAGEQAPGASGGTSTSTIVAAVVGSCLVALLLVAIIVFFVVQRNRRDNVNPAAFDAPPPEMEDSDGSAPSSSEHSESQRSVDYLDDDSTFTAATSNQADPEAGVTLDKDVWGRGSS